MLFKLCNTIDRFNIRSSDILSFTLDSPEAIRFYLRTPNEEERAKGYESKNALLDILGEFVPTKKALPVFDALFEGRYPPGDEKAKSAEEMIIRVGYPIGLHQYPDPFISFVDKVYDRLSVANKTLVGLLRWRYAQEGPLSPISGGNFLCSNDNGNSWQSIPPRYGMRDVTLYQSTFKIKEADVNEIRELITTGQKEPIYHELLREAKELQYSSPRSSILIAMSAAEVAVKFTIAKKVPESTWLLDSIQSPSLVKILTDYFPVLFPYKIKPYKTSKENSFIETIKDGVSIRNKIIHQGDAPPSIEKVKAIIKSVQELLWVCDYCSDYHWAITHTRHDLSELSNRRIKNAVLPKAHKPRTRAAPYSVVLIIWETVAIVL